MLTRLLALHDPSMVRVLRRQNVDVVFGPLLAHRYWRIPSIVWLPDFQHIHLPHLFSEAELIERDRVLLQCARAASRVVVMSHAVRQDVESFAPMYAHKVRVVHPVSYVPESIYLGDLDSVLRLYHLPKKFVYLPNQFWKHKNHEVVFRAVKILQDRGIALSLVCTGSPLDYRHPTFFPNLLRQVSRWGIRDRIIYLGLVPHDHVLLLMRQSLCVVNPSLFEGWGLTAAEAQSVGKRVVLSDIAAHREQNPPKATFFDPKDCEDLADKLANIWHEARPGPDLQLESEARDRLPHRLRAAGEQFMSLAREALEDVRS